MNPTMKDSKPIRIQLSRKKGFKLPENTVVVARPSKWGNPYVVGTHGDRALCVEMFRNWLKSGAPITDSIKELRGKNLACWCKLGTACHADVLLEIANQPPRNPNLTE